MIFSRLPNRSVKGCRIDTTGPMEQSGRAHEIRLKDAELRCRSPEGAMRLWRSRTIPPLAQVWALLYVRVGQAQDFASTFGHAPAPRRYEPAVQTSRFSDLSDEPTGDWRNPTMPSVPL